MRLFSTLIAMVFAVFAHAQSGGVGVWIGTIIPVANGGTGLEALGTANQQLRVNAGATALEYVTVSGGGSVATDAIWDAVGDLAVGSGADAAVRLPRGTALQQIRVNASGTNIEYFTPATASGSVATDAIWDAVGDLAVGSGANTAVRLAMGTANQQIRVNAGGTNIEYFTPSAGSGDITNGGNTTGAAITIGTNDAFGLNLETNNIARVAITGAASTGGAVTITDITSKTNTVEDVLTLRANSSGTPAAGIGVGINFRAESSGGDNANIGSIAYSVTNTNLAFLASEIIISGASDGSITEVAKFTPSTGVLRLGGGATTFSTNGILNSSQFNIGADVGAVVISNTSTNNISIHNTHNTTTSTAGITIGNATSFTQTSGTRNYVNYNSSFAPTSGTAIHNKISLTGTLNQTGGANGIVRGINIANTMTAVADYRAIEIADNHANAKGFYQTGALTTNNLVGRTTFGATTAPTALIQVAAGSTTVAPIKLTSGTNLTTPEAGTIEFDGTEFYANPSTTRTTMARVLKASSTLDFGATAAGASTDLTLTVTGATAGDPVILGVDGSSTANTNGSFSAWVSATNTVTIRFSNNDLVSAINPSSATFRVSVIK